MKGTSSECIAEVCDLIQDAKDLSAVLQAMVVETAHSRNCCKKVVEVWTAGGGCGDREKQTAPECCLWKAGWGPWSEVRGIQLD